jgi:hypothetical protein
MIRSVPARMHLGGKYSIERSRGGAKRCAGKSSPPPRVCAAPDRNLSESSPK